MVAKALPLLVFFLVFDLAFFGANTLKVVDGGWVPIAIGAVFFTSMVVWKRGRRMLADRSRTRPVEAFLAELPAALQGRTTGTGVFLAAMSTGIPPILAHQVERVHVLHDKVVLLTIVTAQSPFVPDRARFEVEKLELGFFRVTARYGFMETPNVPRLLTQAKSAVTSTSIWTT